MKSNKIKMSALSAAIVLSLAACGGSDNKSQKVEKSLVVNDVTLNELKHWQSTEFFLPTVNLNGNSVTTKFSENGQEVVAKDGVYAFSHGQLQLVDGKKYQYTSLTGEDSEIEYTVSAEGQTASAKIIITNVIGDPLANQQWHLRNTGQKAYALSDEMKKGLVARNVSSGRFKDADEAAKHYDEVFAKHEEALVAGEDMNVVKAYQQGVTGQGVIAVVVDSGLEIKHEDLEANVVPNRSVNLRAGAADKTDPKNTAFDGDHGTSVAGILAAKGWNGLGGRGVAPDTQLIGMNYLLNRDNDEVLVPQAEFIAHGMPGSGISTKEEIAVFNRSYGISYPSYFSYSEINEEIESYPNRVLRDGKGAVNIKSSGNSFRRADSICEVNGANELGLSCLNSTAEASQASPYYFSVGAVNTDGKHTSYSSAGPNVMVAAPSGEYGRYGPTMITTDPMTCLSGVSGFEGRNIALFSEWYDLDFAMSQFPFDYPGHEDNVNCNYRSTMNGTSSAAPNASGVVSLILSANNELTWRDVRHILATTSSKNDPENEQVVIEVGEDKFVAHQGWFENAAGYKFNNLYGFGRVDAGAAVALAKSYNVDLGKEIITDWVGEGNVIENDKGESQDSLNKSIPDGNGKGLSHSIEVADELVIESMQFKFNIFNEDFNKFGYPTTAGSDLAIEVTSPSGTKSVLLTSRQAITRPSYSFENGFNFGYIMKDGVVSANAFYGESAKGTWTFRFLDTNGQNIVQDGAVQYVNNVNDSIVEGVAIRAFGHAAK